MGLIGKTFDSDRDLVSEFLETLYKTGSDFTNSFRILAKIPYPGNPDFESKFEDVKEFLVQNSCTVEDMKKSFAPKMDPKQLQMFKMLMEMNPGLLEQMGIGYKRIAKEMENSEKLSLIKVCQLIEARKSAKCDNRSYN